MKLQHPLLTFLGKVLPGQSSGTMDEAVIEIPSVVLPTVELPTPMLFGTFDTLNGATVRNTFNMSQFKAISANYNSTLFILEAGVWDIEASWQVVKQGAVEDLASTVTWSESIANVNLGVTELCKFVNTGVIRQTLTKRWRLVVHKDHPISYLVTTTLGGAVGTNWFHGTYRCNRLL